MNYLFILHTKDDFFLRNQFIQVFQLWYCPLPDSCHLAVGCFTRLAQVGAARRHLRAEPRLPQLNLQYKSRLIQLSIERRKFEQIRESDSLRASSFTRWQYQGTGFIDDGAGLFSESGSTDPDTDLGFMTKNLNIFIHKKTTFFSFLLDVHEGVPNFTRRLQPSKQNILCPAPFFHISRIVLVSGMNFFYIKNCNSLVSKQQEKTSALKKEHPALQKLKFIKFSMFVGHFCRPGSRSGSGSRIPMDLDSM